MTQTALIFSHTDLDGVGGVIIGHQYAMDNGWKTEYHCCGYKGKYGIDNTIKTTLELYDVSEIACILISDIAPNEETAKELNGLHRQGIDVLLCDHHETSTWLNKYSWAHVQEADSTGVLRCGTYWLAKILGIYDLYHVFVNAVNAWDCWTWKETNNVWPKNLNSLLQVMGKTDFITYIEGLPHCDIVNVMQLFDEHAQIMVQTFNNIVNRQSLKAERNLYTVKLTIAIKDDIQEFLAGITWASENVSYIGDYILDRYPYLDFVTMFTPPNSISFRARKELNVPLGEIAKVFTGSGGGHPVSAGAAVSERQVLGALEATIKHWSHNKVRIHSIQHA